MFLPIGRVEGSRTCSNKVTVPAGSEATVRGGLEVRREEIDGVLSVCNTAGTSWGDNWLGSSIWSNVIGGR